MIEDRDDFIKLLKEKAYRKGEYTLSSGRTSEHYVNCKPVTLSGEGLLYASCCMLECVEEDSVAVAGLTLGADPLVSGVALVSAICEYYGIPVGEYDVAEDAIEIERKICDLPGGKQDQFAAAFGGFNYIDCLKDGRTGVNPLRLNYKTQNMMELNAVVY